MKGRFSDGNVRGCWASAGWWGDEAGVAIGEGKTVIGFIPASRVDEAISMFEQEATKEALEKAQIIRDARADIPKLMVRVPQLPKAAKAGSN